MPSACASNPTNRWAQARVTLSRVQDSILIAHEGGLVDDETLIIADPLVQSARAGLDSAELYLPGGGEGFEYYLGIADDIIDRLIILASEGGIE